MDIIVKPKEWVLPNRIGYNKKIYNTFNPSNYAATATPTKAVKPACKCTDDTCDLEDSYVKLLRQQKIVKDYMQYDSPYRGILLYHELGSGKSIASIAAAEGYVNLKKIVIMTPASLSQNYENELLIASKIGRDLKKTWTQIKVNKKSVEMMKELSDKYAIAEKFVKKNGLAWIPLYKGDIDGAEVVIEKIKYNSDTRYRAELDVSINHILRNRYTFINYNGLTEKMIKELGAKPFDNAFIIIDEIHNFISRIVNGSRLAKSIYIHMMNAKGTKLILLSGTPIINQPHEIATLINLVRGPIKEFNVDLLKKSNAPDLKAIVEHLQADNLYRYVDSIDYTETTMTFTLIPDNFKRLDDNGTTITKDTWAFSQEDVIKRVVESLNKANIVKLSIKNKVIINEALPTDKVIFNKLFIDDSSGSGGRGDDKVIAIKNEDLFKRRILGTISYYKTTGSDLFPRMLPTISHELFMSDHQIKKYLEVRLIEIRMDDRKKLFKGKGGGDDIGSVYRAFSRMVCNFAFPDEIARVFPNDVRVLMKKELKEMANVDSDNADIEDADAAKQLNKDVVAAYSEQLDAR